MAQQSRRQTTPWAMPWADKKAVLIRTWKEAGEDNVGIVAAGVAFYGFLAIVPLIAATVLTYGLVADPRTVLGTMERLTQVMPAQAADVVGEQLMSAVQTSGGKKGFGLLLALALALFGARNGAGAVITALNIAYEEKEKRGVVILNLTALAITAAAVLVAIVAVGAMTALSALDEWLSHSPALALVGQVVSYLFLALAGAAAAATLYRFGPSRTKPRWTWITPGSILASVGWVVLTLGFGFYVSSFGNYNATYGSLGAIVVLLTWLYLSAYILIFGAELNSEFEHQTAGDTTAGANKPAGRRGAWAADHVAGEGAPAAPVRGKPAHPAAAGGMVASAVATGVAILLKRRWSALVLLVATARLARKPDEPAGRAH